MHVQEGISLEFSLFCRFGTIFSQNRAILGVFYYSINGSNDRCIVAYGRITGELERIWKDETVASKRCYPSLCFDSLTKTTKILDQMASRPRH